MFQIDYKIQILSFWGASALLCGLRGGFCSSRIFCHLANCSSVRIFFSFFSLLAAAFCNSSAESLAMLRHSRTTHRWTATTHTRHHSTFAHRHWRTFAVHIGHSSHWRTHSCQPGRKDFFLLLQVQFIHLLILFVGQLQFFLHLICNPLSSLFR